MSVKYISFLLAAVLMCSCAGVVDPEADQGSGDTDSENVIDSSKDIDSGYLKRHLAMLFTSTGCVECPLLSASMKEIQKNIPGAVIPVAFHMDYTQADPMTLSINRKFYDKVSWHDAGVVGLPLFCLNFRKGEKHIVNEYAKMDSEIKDHESLYPAICGVSVASVHDPASSTVKAVVGFKADKAGFYRCHIFLVEDGLEYTQAGNEDPGYRHDNVLRALAADNVLGTKLNAGKVLEPGAEYVVEKSFKLSSGWKVENMRVVAAMLDTQDGGETWLSNNVNEAAVGASSEYAYEK